MLVLFLAHPMPWLSQEAVAGGAAAAVSTVGTEAGTGSAPSPS